jgi:regulator of protease activity HflC (stomatin/prohibitin superfamily)
VSGFIWVPIVIIFLVIIFFIIVRIVQINEYEKAVLLRFGRFERLLNPGWHIIIPLIQRAMKIDMRIRTIDVPPQEVITRDNVTITVDAVVYFNIFDAKLALLAAEDFFRASALISMTVLRDVVGEYYLDVILSQRDEIANKLTNIIDKATDPWGVKVTAVELKQVILPESMKRVMAAEAEAEREKRSKIIHAQGELESSKVLVQAAQELSSTPVAIQLRFMQTLTDIAAEKSTIVAIPLPEKLMDSIYRLGGAKETS